MKLPGLRWGKGRRPALLLHGFTGTAESWTPIRPALEAHLDALALDLPGHRGAPLPAASGEEGFLCSVDALADALEGYAAPAVVIGYSQGARLALALATRWPELVSALILESGSPGLGEASARCARRAEDETWARLLEERGLTSFVEAWEALPLFASLRQLPAGVQQELRARRSSHDAQRLAMSLRCLGLGMQPDLWPRLPSLRRPVLILAGERDEKFTLIGRRMAELLPEARCRIIAGCGHAPHLEAPQEWASEVITFLEGLGAVRSALAPGADDET